MTKIVEVPEIVSKELELALLSRYPDLENSKDVFRSISFDRGNSPSSVYSASITYYFWQNSSTALFEYSESFDKHGAPERHWYCRHDWQD